MVGRVQSAAGFLSSLVQPLGPLVGGFLLADYGARTAYVSLGAVFLVGALVLSLAPSVRRSGPAQAPAPAEVLISTD